MRKSLEAIMVRCQELASESCRTITTGAPAFDLIRGNGHSHDTLLSNRPKNRANQQLSLQNAFTGLLVAAVTVLKRLSSLSIDESG